MNNKLTDLPRVAGNGLLDRRLILKTLALGTAGAAAGLDDRLESDAVVLMAGGIRDAVDAELERETIREEVREELKAQDQENGGTAPQPA